MATHSSILAWEIPWTEEPGRLQSMGWQELDVTEVTQDTKYHYQLFFVQRSDIYNDEKVTIVDIY